MFAPDPALAFRLVKVNVRCLTEAPTWSPTPSPTGFPTDRPTRSPTDDPTDQKQKRVAYYNYVAEAPGPTVSIVQDLDDGQAGFTA